jgi:hypothetical protein
MPKSKRNKTLADYLVIAISPLLIMTLVGSLTFFLVQLTYHGQYEMRLKWILFWFVSAAVLVARIAIEQGKEHATMFGIALTAAVGLAAIRLVDEFLLAWALLAVCWWCTWKLTWDCTLIDDNEDASGEGLLQAAGFRDETTPPAQGESVEPEATDARTDVEPAATNRPVHAPGKWVVYFSLAALPIFGIGQLFIPSRDTEARAYGFSLLALYVASALGLLLTTSFLGLRRYLRQRNLQMPAAMTRTWLATGTAVVIALLCLALLLPQPQGEYSVTALVDKIDTKLREASRFAVVRGDRAKGEGRRIGQQDPKERKGGDAPPEDRNARARRKQGDGQRDEQNGGDQKGESKDGGEGEKKADGQGQEKQQGQDGGGRKERGDQQQNDNFDKNQPADKRQAAAERPKEAERQENRSSPPPPASSGSAINSFLQFLASLFKWLVYGALAVVAFIMVNRHWSRIREFLGQLWAELLNLLGLRREREQVASTERGASLAIEVRPFAAYENPFFSGAAQRMSPAQLVRYTFEALEAWAREQVVPRPPEQTPLEFAEELGRRVPALAKDVTSTAELYVRVAYARKNPSRAAVEVLERLWRRMGMGAGAGV